MNADSRPVTTDALETLGTIIDESAGRDAIHLAVEPVIAGQLLSAGDHVTIKGGLAVRSMVGQGLGIVDPFIDGLVDKGERFWLVVYPRQITSLRHVWTHPAFDDAAPAIAPNDPVGQSKAWIEAFATSIDQTYNRLMSAAELWVDDHDYTYDNTESYKDRWDEFPEFWKHYEIVTGTAVEEGKRESFFTCSC